MSNLIRLADVNLDTNKQLRRSVVVRVLKMWIAKNTKTQKDAAIEFLLLDSDGTIIQATAMAKWITRFKKKLSEGSVFLIQDFNVETNDKKYWQPTRVNNPFKLGLAYETDATLYKREVGIDLFGFKFKSFAELESDDVEEEFYVDVIGAVSKWTQMEEVKNANYQGRKMSCWIQDLDGNSLECVIWEHYGEELIDILTKRGETTEPTILTLQFAKKDVYKVTRVRTTRNESKIAINAKCEAVHEFAERIRAQGLISTSRSVTRTDSYRPSNWDWYNMDKVRNLQQLIDSDEAGWYTVKAYAKTFDFLKGWCYRACGGCNSKVSLDAKVGDYCKHPKCNGGIGSINSRFCLRLVVVDDFSTATFVLFEDIVKQYVTESAEELIQAQNDDDSVDCPPDEFGVILKHEYLCKVKVHERFNLEQGSREYTVDNLTRDESVLKKFDDCCSNEGLSVPFNIDPSTPGDNLLKHEGKAINVVEVEESASNSSPLTPNKRSSSDILEDDVVCTGWQLSSNKIIKTEK